MGLEGKLIDFLEAYSSPCLPTARIAARIYYFFLPTTTR